MIRAVPITKDFVMDDENNLVRLCRFSPIRGRKHNHLKWSPLHTFKRKRGHGRGHQTSSRDDLSSLIL